MSVNKLNAYVVLCTKSRPLYVANFLERYSTANCEFKWHLIMVDGSRTDETNRLVHGERFGSVLKNTTYLRTKRGKPSALNIALEYLRSVRSEPDYVFFVDDDIEFTLHSIELGIKFILERGIIGFSPLLVNIYDKCSLDSKMRIKNITSKTEGRLSQAGNNRWLNNLISKNPWQATEWLPGGACVYAWQKIKELDFDESLENEMLGGYALGEDLLFSFQISQVGEIGCNKEIQVIHYDVEQRTKDIDNFAIARGKLKAKLVETFPERVNSSLVMVFEVRNMISVFRRQRSLYLALRSGYLFYRTFLAK